MNIFQNSQPVLHGCELDREDAQDHAGGHAREPSPQIEIEDLHDAGIDELPEARPGDFQHGLGNLHSDVPAAGAEGVHEWH